LYPWLSRLSSKKLRIIQYDFLPGAEEKFVMSNKNKCLRLGAIGLIVAPWKFDVLKISIFVFNFPGATISANSS